MVDEGIPDEVRANTSFVSPPGVPFVGGSHLVVWKHNRLKRESLSLIQYLNSPDVQKAYSKGTGLLPANKEVLSSPSYSNDQRYQRLVKRLETGRSFRSVPLWGMVEDRLNGAFSALWDDLLSNPDSDVREIVEKWILPFNQRLNMTLRQS